MIRIIQALFFLSSGVFHEASHFRASVVSTILRASASRSRTAAFSSSSRSTVRRSTSAKNSSLLFALAQALMISDSSSRLSLIALTRRCSASYSACFAFVTLTAPALPHRLAPIPTHHPDWQLAMAASWGVCRSRTLPSSLFVAEGLSVECRYGQENSMKPCTSVRQWSSALSRPLHTTVPG